jgi:hypothetical protein
MTSHDLLFKLFINDEEIPSSRPYSDFGRALYKTNTHKDDEVVLVPFNFLDNEGREYKEKVKEYHNIPLGVDAIKRTLIKRANDNVDVVIEYHLWYGSHM